jgi:hypothetical protein
MGEVGPYKGARGPWREWQLGPGGGWTEAHEQLYSALYERQDGLVEQLKKGEPIHTCVYNKSRSRIDFIYHNSS